MFIEASALVRRPSDLQISCECSSCILTLESAKKPESSRRLPLFLSSSRRVRFDKVHLGRKFRALVVRSAEFSPMPLRMSVESSLNSKSLKVALFMGGRSGEYEISVKTGAQVLVALDNLGHKVFQVTLLKFGGATWKGPDGRDGQGTTADMLGELLKFKPDVAFLAMHGADGEDGRLQGTLELLDIPYHGSGVKASAVALDKLATKLILKGFGLPVALDMTMRPGCTEADWLAAADALGLPIVMKTPKSGSSVGVEVADDLPTFLRRGAELLKECEYLLLEKYLPGREFTVPVLETVEGKPEGLPLIEIRPKARFFDYWAKYTAGGSEEICPAPVDPSLAAELTRLGIGTHVAIGCRGYSRTDVKLDADGLPHILEVNTLPGLTPASLLPQAAKEAGLPFDSLIQRLLDNALSIQRVTAPLPSP